MFGWSRSGKSYVCGAVWGIPDLIQPVPVAAPQTGLQHNDDPVPRGDRI